VITFFREINTSKSKSKARRKTASAPYDYVEGCTRERRENNSKKYPLFSLFLTFMNSFCSLEGKDIKALFALTQ
jgi:hypothetical protein